MNSQPASPADPASDLPLPAGATLTRHQWSALRSTFNLADGHSRQSLTAEQLALNHELGRFFQDSMDADQQAVEDRFTASFFRAAGQASTKSVLPPSFHYSASMSIGIVAHHLRDLKGRVGLIHPTFDNIPALLDRHGVPTSPIPADDLCGISPESLDGLCALFLVLPNNPTGECLSATELRQIAAACAACNVVLIIDFSFRFLSEFHKWDQYDVLLASGARFICIEDTGKTWPVLDVKLGMLIADARTQDTIRAITDDYLLNLSPFTFRLLTEYIESDPARSWLGVAECNRVRLRTALKGSVATVCSTPTPLSVAWVALREGLDGDELCRWLAGRGVSLCPGAQFYWHDPDRGRPFVRIALLRPEKYFAEATARLRTLLDEYVGLHRKNT